MIFLIILFAIYILIIKNKKLEHYGWIKSAVKSVSKAASSAANWAKKRAEDAKRLAEKVAREAKALALKIKRAAEALAKFLANLLKEALKKVTIAAKLILKGMTMGLQFMFIGFIKVVFLLIPPIFNMFFLIAGKLWGVITKAAPFLHLLPFLMFMNLMMPLIIPVVCIALALGVFMGPSIPYMLPLIWSVFLFFYIKHKVTSTVDNLNKVNWEKEIKKLIDGKALGNILKTIGKGIIMLFNKIKF